MFGLNWGNGFITNQDILTSRGLSDPNSFFQDLLNKPYVNNVCQSGDGAAVPAATARRACCVSTTVRVQAEPALQCAQHDGLPCQP